METSPRQTESLPWRDSRRAPSRYRAFASIALRLFCCFEQKSLQSASASREKGTAIDHSISLSDERFQLITVMFISIGACCIGLVGCDKDN